MQGVRYPSSIAPTWTAVFGVSQTRVSSLDSAAEHGEAGPMTGIRLEAKRAPPPVSRTGNLPMIDAECHVRLRPPGCVGFRLKPADSDQRLHLLAPEENRAAAADRPLGPDEHDLVVGPHVLHHLLRHDQVA